MDEDRVRYIFTVILTSEKMITGVLDLADALYRDLKDDALFEQPIRNAIDHLKKAMEELDAVLCRLVKGL